jgi:hypothetical protein
MEPSFRLVTPDFWVDVRLAHIDGRIASADTPDGPSLGLGYLPTEAPEQSLALVEGALDDLMRAAPDIPYSR